MDRQVVRYMLELLGILVICVAFLSLIFPERLRAEEEGYDKEDYEFIMECFNTYMDLYMEHSDNLGDKTKEDTRESMYSALGECIKQLEKKEMYTSVREYHF